MFAIIFGVFGVITGLTGMIIGILSYNHNKIDLLNEYFAYAKNTDFIEGKRIIYNLNRGQALTEENTRSDVLNHIACVTNAYQHWGLLVYHKQLPIWIFYDKKVKSLTASGITVIRTFNLLRPTINHFRKKSPQYAESYEWLYKKLLTYCPEYRYYTGNNLELQ